ncbi:MAG: hypothetical protein ACREPM_06965 [Gemmatimonadaceae bacterium]
MAPPTQLKCRDLKSGDIMVQQSLGNVPGKLIAFGQAMTGHKHTELIHAGIMFDTSFIIEALGGGVLASDLRVQNVKCGYLVYRSRKPDLGTIAGNLAKLLFDLHGTNKNMSYSTVGAVKSIGSAKPAKSASNLDGVLDKIFEGKSSPFFCSQFVVVTYQAAGGQIGMSPSSVFPLDDARVAPARLASMLDASPHFDRLGYMLPGER